MWGSSPSRPPRTAGSRSGRPCSAPQGRAPHSPRPSPDRSWNGCFMIEPETIIDGRYRVISRLGSGGMADVYLAQDQLLGREVAVKVLHRHFAEDHEFVERFRREASSAAGLSHPNIVGIFARGECDRPYYIAMEYVAGRSPESIVRANRTLEPAAAIAIVVPILRAPQFAPRRGALPPA